VQQATHSNFFYKRQKWQNTLTGYTHKKNWLNTFNNFLKHSHPQTTPNLEEDELMPPLEEDELMPPLEASLENFSLEEVKQAIKKLKNKKLLAMTTFRVN
jgi:tRNA(Ser,Leu) C12 N-acetylase TAN1